MKPNQFLQKCFLLCSLVCAFSIAIIASCTKEDIQSPSDEEISITTSSNAETTPPTVKFTFRYNGDTLSDSITIKIKATDSAGIASVQCKLDGVSLGIKTASPYNFGWNTRTVMNGAHQLLAKAVDVSGNSRTKRITVQVFNCKDWVFATLVNKSGLDGCGWVLQLSSGAYLEPINLKDFNIELIEGKVVSVSYVERKDMVSACMIGKIVEIKYMKEEGK